SFAKELLFSIMESSAQTDILHKRFQGCIIGGAIGDAWGSGYENVKGDNVTTTFYLGGKKTPVYSWAITDDTQLTLATCEAIAENTIITPEILANKFVQYYKRKKLSGLGASTLKALRELEVGGHWSLVGRTGEYAAGNGAAMRIAPFAFKKAVSREEIRDFCRITHRNDEAYTGALAVVLAIRAIIHNVWTDDMNLLDIIISDLPDTRTRDRLMEINQLHPNSITEVAKLGTSGYAPDSIPLAIFAASQIKKTSFESILSEVIAAGGDTDTNASLTGQIAGSFLTLEQLPPNLMEKLMRLDAFDWIEGVVNRASFQLNN
ncbi:MAG: ADP-ribosylglycohydrolase family protein, partial [Chitinophagaceae bacterium]